MPGARGNSPGWGALRAANGAPVIYALRDQFNTDRAAGAVNGTPAEPGPGTRVVVDTESKLSVSGGKLVFAGGKAAPAWGDPAVTFGSYARKAGRMLRCTFTPTAQGANGASIGWFQAPNPTSNTENGWRYGASGAATLSASEGGFLTPGTALYSVSGPVDLVTILRSSGAFDITIDGAGAVLHWVNTARSQATIHPGVSNNDGRFALSNLRVVDLGAPWNSDYGIATQRLTGARQVGDTFRHSADCLIGTTASTLPPDTSSMQLRFRMQDPANFWRVSVNNTGDIYLHEHVDGVSTLRGSAVGVVSAGHGIVIVADGTTIKVYSNNALRITYASAANFSGCTSGSFGAAPSGGVYSDIVTWPRRISGAALAALNRG